MQGLRYGLGDGMGRKNNRLSCCLYLLLAAGCLLVGIEAFAQSGPVWDKLFSVEGRKMIGETLAFFGWMLVCFCWSGAGKRPMAGLRAAGIGVGMGLGLWCHQILLPFLVSGVWLLGLGLAGDWFFRRWKGEMGNFLLRLAADGLIGCGGWICLVCVLSAFHIGGLNRLRIIAAMLAVLALGSAALAGRACRFRKKSWGLSRTEGLFCAVMLTMVFVQLARINLMPDYDSLHYGLRSHYILDAGSGIYENLGNINLVYTYPKGWEILSFPLSGTITYGYQLCFSLWMAVLVLVLAGGLVVWAGGSRKMALFCGMVVSLIPGVMNMGITAKSDLATLVCQLLILWGAMGICKSTDQKEKASWFCISSGACLLSFSMKPTALVFSSVLSISCLAVLGVKKGFKENKISATDKEGQAKVWQGVPVWALVLVLLSLGAWMGTWARTFLMTGVPTTSVFTSIWEKLGFSVKWPYAFSSIPSQGLEMSAAESAGFLLRRLSGVFLFPAGDDMFHVRLAWGSASVLLSLSACLLWGMGRGKEKSCIRAALAGISLVGLVSLYLLWQVDGNYYMLFYVLAVVAGSIALGNSPWCLLSTRQKEGKDLSPKWGNHVVFAMFLAVQAGTVMGTSWAGNTGFTPVKLFHSGVFDHQKQRYEEKCALGNQEIWTMLSQDARARVLAVGEHPQVLQFPCNVQSYYDLTGSGGNVRLVKTLEEVKKFLRFAQIEYIYVEAGYLEEGSRAYDVVRYLIEEGSLAQLYFSQGNMLGRVNLAGEIPTEPEQEAERFYQQIGMKKDE